MMRTFQRLMQRKLSRKGFLKMLISSVAFLSLSGVSAAPSAAAAEPQSTGRVRKNIKGDHDLVVAEGADPYVTTVKAVEAMGGMGRFVKEGDVVVVKPNIGWDRTPAQAGNTNPMVVAALIDLSREAGAKKVNIFDVTCNDPKRCYESSGIRAVARERGANLYFPDDWNTVKAHFAHASAFEGWPILKDAIDCDVFINVPVLKHHGLTRLTLSMKNLMGVCGGNRGVIHQNIGEKVADLTAFINPDLTVIDAHRALMRNGPTGGNLADVEQMNTVVVGTDPLLADIFACGLMKVAPADVPYVRVAMERSYGASDIAKADILRIRV